MRRAWPLENHNNFVIKTVDSERRLCERDDLVFQSSTAQPRLLDGRKGPTAQTK
jgi:hypothetical protein